MGRSHFQQITAQPLTRSYMPGRPERTLFGHPRGLTVLFLTGMWEVFALFGMRTILIYYLIKQLHFSSPTAVQVYSLSSAACLVMGLIGGAVADNYLGMRRAVFVGALLMAVGNSFLVFAPLLYLGLAFIAVGNGLLKPTLAAQVGLLYAHDDPRRDRAFTAYKVGCNLGAMMAPLVCGTIGAIYGWNWGFAASSIGMLVAIVIFWAGRRLVPEGGAIPRARGNPSGRTGVAPSRGERDAMIIIAIAGVAGVLFWTAYKQIESTVALWADSGIDRIILIGTHALVIPAAWFQSVNPFMIFAFAPLVNWLWSRHAARVSASDDLRKMATGSLLLAGAFGILSAASLWSGNHQPGAIWLLIAIAPLTIAELYVDPIGQALFSRLAPRNLVALFVGVWFLTSLGAYLVSIWLGNMWVHVSPAVFFACTAAFALVSGPLFLAAQKYDRSL